MKKKESSKLTVLQSGGLHLLKFLRYTISVIVFILDNSTAKCGYTQEVQVSTFIL